MFWSVVAEVEKLSEAELTHNVDSDEKKKSAEFKPLLFRL